MSAEVTAPPPDLADVARICGIGDRVIRNLEITECYARLSRAIAVRTGGGANWCAFATWASKQAGQTIRGEDLWQHLRRRLGPEARLLDPLESVWRALLRKGLFGPETRLGRVVAAIHTPFDAFERASEAVAVGNLKVFAEIGREFARYLQACPAEAGVDSPEFRRFVEGLRPGDPPDGQERLRRAFTGYQAQRHEPDPRRRAALMLLANLEVGLHEQTRLQPQIAEALDAPLATAGDLGGRVLEALVPSATRWPAALRGPAAGLLGWWARTMRRVATGLTRAAITDALMVLTLPGGTALSLGRDLEVPLPASFAGELEPELAGFISRHDPCPAGHRRCGASDWADLGQRMHYILHLFRAYHEDASLFSGPFSADQVTTFRAGRVPAGNL